MDKYTIYCTAEQTKNALKLDAPIQFASINDIRLGRYIEVESNNKTYVIPTAEQMIGWLDKQGVKCFILQDSYDDYSYNIQINNTLITTGHPQYNYPLSYNSYKEAILAVIDAALEYLKNNKIT